jgi:hypothetical protein
VRYANAETATVLTSIATADAHLDAAADVARAHEAIAIQTRTRALHAGTLVEATHRVSIVAVDNDMRYALLNWASAVGFIELADVFAEVKERVRDLGSASTAMATELGRLQLAETGGLAIEQLRLLHETSKEVLQSEMLNAEVAMHDSERKYAATARRLRKREDDLVLLIQSFETLRDDHKNLEERVASAKDGSAAHATRLQAQVDQLSATATTNSKDMNDLLVRHDEMTAKLTMRERQLALCMTHLESGKTQAELLRTKGTVAENRLRSTLELREDQLVRLVRELYELATAERVPGVVAHDARSRVFRRCAIVYEQLGEDAFREQGVDDVNPVLESPLDAMARTMAEEALPPAAAAAALPLQASERYADATVRL